MPGLVSRTRLWFLLCDSATMRTALWYIWVMSHIYGSWRTYKSHDTHKSQIGMSNITHIQYISSRHTRDTHTHTHKSHVWVSHVPHTRVTHIHVTHIQYIVISYTCRELAAPTVKLSDDEDIYESCHTYMYESHTYEWVMSHIYKTSSCHTCVTNSPLAPKVWQCDNEDCSDTYESCHAYMLMTHMYEPLFCRIKSLLEGSFAKETYILRESTNRSHPIMRTAFWYTWIVSRMYNHDTNVWVMSHTHTCMSHVKYMWVSSQIFELCHVYESCHAYMSHVTRTWVMSHIFESYHTFMSHVGRFDVSEFIRSTHFWLITKSMHSFTCNES